MELINYQVAYQVQSGDSNITILTNLAGCLNGSGTYGPNGQVPSAPPNCSGTSAYLAAAANFTDASGFPSGSWPQAYALTSGMPVLTTDTTAAATIYYTPYIGNWCTLWNGTIFQQVAFSETSMALDSNSGHTGYQAAGSLFEVFAFLNGGAFTIGTGPAWANSTPGSSSRGTGAGTTQIQPVSGIWLNSVPITLRYGNGSGDAVGVPSGQATYLGTMYATADGQTGMQFAPAAASGGSNAILGLFNAYNQVPVISHSQDSTASWNYGSTTAWQPADNSTSNRVSWVDGLGQSFAEAEYLVVAASAGLTGIGINTTSAPTGVNGYNSGPIGLSIAARAGGTGLGFNFAQALEIASGGTAASFSGGLASPFNQVQDLRLLLRM